jgi:lipid-binding SYLF domain-containing protein
MNRIIRCLTLAAVLTAAGAVQAGDKGDKYEEAITSFKQSPKSGAYFKGAYGYAIFPDVGKAGFIVGGEHGDGKVYEKGKLVGTASVTQLSVGAQAGAKEYAEIIFFQKQVDFEKFKGGEFQLSGDLEATAITLNASASAGTETSSAEASTTRNNAATGGGYNNGVAVFTIVRGGLLAGASVGGQKIKFKEAPKK